MQGTKSRCFLITLHIYKDKEGEGGDLKKQSYLETKVSVVSLLWHEHEYRLPSLYVCYSKAQQLRGDMTGYSWVPWVRSKTESPSALPKTDRSVLKTGPSPLDCARCEEELRRRDRFFFCCLSDVSERPLLAQVKARECGSL